MKAKELLREQTSVEENQSKKELDLNSESEDMNEIVYSELSPHVAVKLDGSWRLALGKTLVSNVKYDSADEAIADVEHLDWELVLNSCFEYIRVLNEELKK